MEKYINLKNFWKNKKVFITGHTGFKGSWMCIMLNLLGAKIYGYSLKPEKKSLFIQSRCSKFLKKNTYSNIINERKLNKSINKIKPDILFHLAAQPLVIEGYKNPIETFNTNINGTINVLNCIRNCKSLKSAVIITTDKVYKIQKKNKFYSENDELGGSDPYSASKVCTEILTNSFIQSFFKMTNLRNRVSSARSGNVIGGGDMKADRIIPDIIKSIIKKNNIVLRNPAATRPWQHVLEPLSGYLLIGSKLLNKKLKKGIIPSWNFGPHPKNCKSVSYITKLALQRWGDLNLKIRKEKRKKYHESSFLSLNIKKSKKELNWQPRLNIEDTIKFTVEWYKKFFKGDQIEKFTYCFCYFRWKNKKK